MKHMQLRIYIYTNTLQYILVHILLLIQLQCTYQQILNNLPIITFTFKSFNKTYIRFIILF